MGHASLSAPNRRKLPELKKMKKVLKQALPLLLVFTVVAANAYLQQLWAIDSTGTVVAEGVVVYWDAAGTENVTEIDWGRLVPGENKTVLVYVKNVGNEASNITLWTADWSSPEADMYLQLEWNYTGAVIDVFEIIPVELILVVHPDIEDVHDFNFQIGISIESIYW